MFAISWLVSMHLSGFDASFFTHSCSIWGTSTPNDGLVYYQATGVNCLNSNAYDVVFLSLSWVGWVNSLHESPSMCRLLLKQQQRIRRRRGQAARSFITTNILSKTLHAWFGTNARSLKAALTRVIIIVVGAGAMGVDKRARLEHGHLPPRFRARPAPLKRIWSEMLCGSSP